MGAAAMRPANGADSDGVQGCGYQVDYGGLGIYVSRSVEINIHVLIVMWALGFDRFLQIQDITFISNEMNDALEDDTVTPPNTTKPKKIRDACDELR